MYQVNFRQFQAWKADCDTPGELAMVIDGDQRFMYLRGGRKVAEAVRSAATGKNEYWLDMTEVYRRPTFSRW